MPWLLLPEIFVKIFPDSFSPVPDSCQDNGSESCGMCIPVRKNSCSILFDYVTNDHKYNKRKYALESFL